MKNFLIFIILLSACKARPKFLQEQEMGMGKVSKPIEWSLVQKMMEEYSHHPSRLLTEDPASGVELTLEGLRVDTGSLKSIMKNSKVGTVIIYFGVKEGHLEREPRYQHFTTVIAGIDDKNHLVKYELDSIGNPNLNKSAMYNYSDPCPRNCPDTTK